MPDAIVHKLSDYVKPLGFVQGGAAAGAVLADGTVELTANWEAGPYLISAANSLNLRNALEYVTGGDGSSGNPYTSASGTAGIQEACNALPSIGGVVYIPTGYWKITVPINMTANNAPGIGSSSPAHPVKVIGDGPRQTVLVGETKAQGGYAATYGPVFDLIGTNFNTIQDLAIVYGTTNRSSIGILIARASTGYSQYTQNNTVQRVYIELLHDATANGGAGTVGIYGYSSDTGLFINNSIVADIPYVLTGQNVYNVVSPNQTGSALNSAAQNIIIGGAASGYYSSVVLQGGAHNNNIDSVALIRSGAGTGTVAVNVLADTGTPSNRLYGLRIVGDQIEGWETVLSTTAPIFKPHIDCTWSQDASGSLPGILMAGANAQLERGEIRLSNNNAGSVQKLIGDSGVGNNGVHSCSILLGTPLTINASSTPGTGNLIYCDKGSAPTITWSAPDPAQILINTNKTVVDVATPVNSLGLSTGNNDDFVITVGQSFYRQTTLGSAATVRGIAGGYDGRHLYIMNQSGQTVTFNNNDANSGVNNRMYLNGATVALTNGHNIWFIYSGTDSKWIQMGNT